ncbi:hypothetical protein BN1263470006 [Stenotrophomonas thermophila]|nr:hypothetical protein BN1263470006 [Stenotrophomonas maltophilia]
MQRFNETPTHRWAFFLPLPGIRAVFLQKRIRPRQPSATWHLTLLRMQLAQGQRRPASPRFDALRKNALMY